jgi:methionyl aminopeptidase
MSVAAGRIVLKSPREIELMRAAGRVVVRVLDAIAGEVCVGCTTASLNATAERLIREAGAQALFLGVTNPQSRGPFPASICSSINDEVVHGIPDERPLAEGDIVKVDCGVRLRGYCGDAARTFAVGRIAPEARRLLDVTKRALDLAVENVRPYQPWGKVAKLMQEYVERAGFGVVRDFVGHGIGREMHEEPKVPNYVDRRSRDADFELLPGMTLAVEPMVTVGKPDVEYRDRTCWTVVTKDGSLAAHFEHTLAVTQDGVSVLTDGK